MVQLTQSYVMCMSPRSRFSRVIFSQYLKHRATELGIGGGCTWWVFHSVTLSAMWLPVDLHSYKYETKQEMGDDAHLLLCSCSGSKSPCFFLKQVLNHHSLLSQLDSNLLFASPPPFFFFFSSFTFFAATHFYLGFPYLLCFHMISHSLLGLAKRCTVDSVGCL